MWSKRVTGRLLWIATFLVFFFRSYEAFKPASPIPVYFDSTNDGHQDRHYHPEQPERIHACVKALRDYQRETGGIQLTDVAAQQTSSRSSSDILHQPFSQVELDHARDMLLKVHNPDIVRKLEETCRTHQQQLLAQSTTANTTRTLPTQSKGSPAPVRFLGNMDPDTYVTSETFDVCLRATATWIRALDQGPAFALTRPPGHHATRNQSNGFCLYNFAAATVAHALSLDSSLRVSVLDWDVHYGQGVADILQDYSPQVRYVSIHQTEAFPYMGNKKHVQGQYQNVLTLPMPACTTWTCGYEALFDQALEFIIQKDEWEPDVVIVCAGYDALGSDELASVELNANDYGEMTRRLKQRMEHLRHSPRWMLGLEGGYQLGKMVGAVGNLQQAVIETLSAM